MRPYKFSVDTTADITKEYGIEHGIDIHPLHYMIDEKEYGWDEEDMDIHEFYDKVKAGAVPVTNATHLDYDIQLMEKSVEEGYDIIHISFSSAMSSSYANAVLAAKEVMERHPEAKITVFDSLSALGAITSVLRKGMEMQAAGADYDAVCKMYEESIPHMVLHFTVPDLFHLFRGGRLKRSAAILGTVLKLQPLLRITEEGTLEACGKVRGRTLAMKGTCDVVARELEKGAKPDTIFISHGDCEEDAKIMAKMIEDRFHIPTEVHLMSPTLGSHAGAGVLAMGFVGVDR